MGTITDSAGVTIVSNPEQGVWSDADRWAVEEDLRIGALEGDPRLQFGEVGGIAVGSDGSIHVLDVQALHIKVYSPEGQYVRTVGGPGGGPGELGPRLRRSSFSLGMGRGDTLLVQDLRNQRVNRYAPDGSHLGSVQVSLEEGIRLLWRTTATGVVAEQVHLTPGPTEDEVASADVIVLRRTDGEVTDTILKFPSGQTYFDAGQVPEVRLFSPEPVWAITDDLRLLFGVTTDYRISVYSPARLLERVITRAFEREAVTDRAKETVMDFLERSWTDAGRPPPVVASRLSMVRLAEFFPVLTKLHSGPRGTLWVQRVPPAATLERWGETTRRVPIRHLTESRGTPEWDVFDTDGRFLGEVLLPPRFMPHVFRGDKIYGVWLDDLDVQYVVRLRVRGMPDAESAP
jgi:hypothetical protein